MTYCMHCGAQLGTGRFCTNCGTPVGSATPPVAEPPAYDAPAWAPSSEPAAAPVGPQHRDRERHRIGWLLLALGVLVALVLASCLALRDDDPEATAQPEKTTSPAASTTSASPSPVDSGRAGVDLARDATVKAPDPIRPGTDLAGRRVPYPASNMLDGKRSSAYRLAGNAAGTVILFDLGASRTVTAVGLVNGYAKVDNGTDWYPLNRRITKVEWRFADGTTLTQELVDTPDFQTMQISPEETAWVELRLVDVSKPGGGKRGKDTTAISDVLLLGS